MISKSWFCGLLTAVVLVCGCDEEIKKAKVERNMVKLETSMGNIVIELNEQAAPVTVKNFLGYVEEGFYDGTIFHRVMPGFMIQGGGFTTEMEEKQTREAIINEAKNGLKNERGTIAMARTNDPDSATCQFFINHRNNGPLNYVENGNPGYAVFGKVIEGMDVVDAIASVVTTTRKNKKGEDMGDVPVEPVVIKSARVVSE
ncbi:MAG: peptidyl-prolyl cis-trans isomerase [Planctomycetes bacterium]|nr:peptidyl-prolyl cis-trans isomerase [Planctomycetota bacterium]MCH8119479.1 peptidyl-prolyl cis-trans isomerase [Planctomycetota bacterium]